MVHYRDRQGASVQNSVRELSLLDGEKIEQLFVPENGLVSDTPWKGQLLVLTNQRLISFVQSDGHQETLLAPLDELKGVSVKANARGSRDLLQGFALMIIGIVSYLVLGYVPGRGSHCPGAGSCHCGRRVVIHDQILVLGRRGKHNLPGG